MAKQVLQPMLAQVFEWVVENPSKALDIFVNVIKKREQYITKKGISQKEVSKIEKKEEGVVKTVLTPWRTIDVGGMTNDGLVASIEKDGMEVSPLARALATRGASAVAEKPEKVHLAVILPRDLGFTKTFPARRFVSKEFCTKWSEENLVSQVIEPCDLGDGLQLRSQYKDQPGGEILWLAMEPTIVSPERGTGVFTIGRQGNEGRCYIGVDLKSPDDEWGLGLPLIFRLREAHQLLTT
ncbi:MAG: hypothetical protein Q7R65_01520 [bacterium]|nr:hypothetical protein [bacterium]